MNGQKLEYLSMVDIFQDLSRDEVATIDQQTTMSTCEAGRIFYMPEQTGEVLFLLKQGRVQLYRISPDGKKLVVATLGPGAVFGEMSLIGQGMHNSFAEALEDCLLCVMSRADVEHLIVTKPKVSLRLLEFTGRRLQEAERRLEEIAFKSIPSRLASLLIRLSEEEGDNTINGYTHQLLGEMLGTYRETTTQTLNEFKGRGLLEIGRKRIKVLDYEGLVEVAQGHAVNGSPDA